MQLIKLYFSPALLLLLLSCPLWQVGQSLPVMVKGKMTASCVLYARELLEDISQSLAINTVTRGINCTKQSVELNMETATPSVCAPEESKCSGAVTSQFNEDLCLTNIGEDLRHYYKFLAAQPNSSLNKTLYSLRELMENCFAWSLPKDLAPAEATDSTYDQRLKLCKVMNGFQSTKEKIIHSNVLIYSPEPSLDGLLKLDGVAIPVECHYEKRYAVDGISLHPTWIPLVSRDSAEDQIDFSLLLMNRLPLFRQIQRGSFSYFVGDPIHLEVSAIASALVTMFLTLVFLCCPKRCLADAYLTNSSSRFLPRVGEHKLRFQLDAFRFYQETSNQIHITCYVKAVPVTLGVSSRNRACSLIENRWRSVDQNDQACRSCDLSHRIKEPPSTEPSATTTSTRAWPVVTPQDRLVQNRPTHRPAGETSSLRTASVLL
ncbi:hypothetical protein L3Q82_006177 [Scortum barcoo]|uniref:Uncharacterized protein n=1 Tax=Scortum barcoo TaxID=214431 RepID=A0ACB8X2S0_9TELE|nr:hypothetical protein L3Q82_006177 [Scortum barcoo]